MFKLQHALKTFLLSLAALFCVTLVAQGQRPRVAVLDPNSSGNVPTRVKRAVTGTMEEQILKSQKYRVVDRDSIDKLLEEQQFAESGLVDKSQVKELGKMLQADILCLSVLDREDGEFVIKCRLVDVETSEVFASATEFMEDDSTSEIKKAIEIVAMKLTGAENPREAQAREQAIKELTERNLREQQEMERQAREKAIREEEEKAERERRQRESERRLAEVTASSIREKEESEKENHMRELAAELARISRSSVPITSDAIKAAKIMTNRLMPLFDYKQDGRTASCVNKVLAKYLENEQAQLKFAQKQESYLLYIEIIKGKLVASSRYGYRVPTNWMNHTMLSIAVDGSSVGRDVIMSLKKTKTNNTFRFRTEESTIHDPEILRPIVENSGRKISITISGSTHRKTEVLDNTIRLAVSQTVELYDAMNVLAKGGIKIQQSYVL